MVDRVGFQSDWECHFSCHAKASWSHFQFILIYVIQVPVSFHSFPMPGVMTAGAPFSKATCTPSVPVSCIPILNPHQLIPANFLCGIQVTFMLHIPLQLQLLHAFIFLLVHLFIFLLVRLFIAVLLFPPLNHTTFAETG